MFFLFKLKKNWKKLFFSFHFIRRADSGADSQTKSCMYVYIYMHHTQVKNRSKSRSSIRMKVYYLLKQNRFHESFNVMIGKTLGGKPGNYHAMDDRNTRFKQSRNGPRWKTDGCYLRRWYYKGSSASFADTKSFFGLQNHFAESSKTEAADFPFGKMSFALLAETVVYNSDNQMACPYEISHFLSIIKFSHSETVVSSQMASLAENIPWRRMVITKLQKPSLQADQMASPS